MHSQYFTTSEAARILHVTRFTVLNWIKQGKLKAVATLGGHQRIPQDAIETLLQDKQTIKTMPVPANRIQRVYRAGSQAVASSKSALTAQKAKIGRMLKKSAYVSGKYIASLKTEFTHILAEKI